MGSQFFLLGSLWDFGTDIFFESAIFQYESIFVRVRSLSWNSLGQGWATAGTRAELGTQAGKCGTRANPRKRDPLVAVLSKLWLHAKNPCYRNL